MRPPRRPYGFLPRYAETLGSVARSTHSDDNRERKHTVIKAGRKDADIINRAQKVSAGA